MLKGAGAISRRRFVKGVALVLAGGALLTIRDRIPGVAWLSQPPVLALQRSLFAGHLGETFQVDRESAGRVAVELSQVRDLPTKAAKTAGNNLSPDQEHCFSLLFRGPADRPLAQGTYRFEHSQFGSFALFIVPMVPDQAGQGYEAIFNCPSL
jgi:hypothetical protein